MMMADVVVRLHLDTFSSASEFLSGFRFPPRELASLVSRIDTVSFDKGCSRDQALGLGSDDSGEGLRDGGGGDVTA